MILLWVKWEPPPCLKQYQLLHHNTTSRNSGLNCWQESGWALGDNPVSPIYRIFPGMLCIVDEPLNHYTWHPGAKNSSVKSIRKQDASFSAWRMREVTTPPRLERQTAPWALIGPEQSEWRHSGQSARGPRRQERNCWTLPGWETFKYSVTLGEIQYKIWK